MSKLQKGAWVHLVAVGGTGMGALAGLLKDLGFSVTGSDGPLYPPMSGFLESKQIPVKAYSKLNLSGSTWGRGEKNPALIVIGNAISRNHEEALETEFLQAQGLCQKLSFPQALAEYCIEDRESFVVAGTHGKSTTSSILAWAMESLKLSPSFLVGGIPTNFSTGCRVGQGSVFVAEGDEYDTAYWDKESKFLHYRSHWVLCTGIEFDHADIYADLQAVELSFLKLCDKTKKGWVLVDGQSAPSKSSVEKVAAKLQDLGKKVFRYGHDPKSDFALLSYQPEALTWEPQTVGSTLKMKIQSETWIVQSPMIGLHNALNVLGVIGVLIAGGHLKTQAQAQEFLKTYRGIKRRQEELFQNSKVIVIDDFAHHPTAIRETVAAIQSRYPNSKIAAFFEPRSATSARNVFEKEFQECFDQAHAVFLSPPTKSNVPEAQKLNIETVAQGLKQRQAGRTVVIDSNVDHLVQSFVDWQKALNTRCVAMVMSNGAFGGLHQKIIDKFK